MYIAAVLEKEGYKVKIIDACLEKLNQMELSRRIISFDPDIVGITADSINYFESLKIARITKNTINAFVVIGGPHATIRTEKLIKYPEVDAIVIGEGEYTMLEIVQRIEKGHTLNGCKGCWYKENGRIIINEARKRIEDLDSLPYPARHLIKYKHYPKTYAFGRKLSFDAMDTSRGCPFKCSFCSTRMIWGSKYVYRSAQSIVDEIEFLIKKYNSKRIYFRDDNFTINRKRIINLCAELKERNINIEWDCSSRVDLVDKDLLEKIYNAGCRGIWYGMESGSPRSLKILNKQITINQIRKVVQLSKTIGLKVGGAFIVGIPKETLKDIKMTADFIKELKLDSPGLSFFYAIPDSLLYQEVVRNNWIDSALGDLLFVKTKEFSHKDIKSIINKIEIELFFLLIIENFKKNPLKTFKYINPAFKKPLKVLKLLKFYAISILNR